MKYIVPFSPNVGYTLVSHQLNEELAFTHVHVMGVFSVVNTANNKQVDIMCFGIYSISSMYK